MAKQLSETLVNMIVRLYEEDTPITKIADELRVDKTTVLKYLRKTGVYEENPDHARKSSRRFSQLEKDRILELYKEGVPVADIAEELDTASASLYQHLNKEGLSRQTPKSDIQKAVEMYHSGHYSVIEVLEKTGVVRSTLYRNLDKY